MGENEKNNENGKCDPLSPQTTINPIFWPNLPDPRRDMQSSEAYIASLEAKLAKLKGKRTSKQPSSRDMINSLCKAKEDHMRRLTDGSDSPYISNHQDEDNEDTEKSSKMAELQRRLQPQQPLTAEELKVLVDNDELAKLMEKLLTDMEQEAHLTSRHPPPKDATGQNEQPKSNSSDQTGDTAEILSKPDIKDDLDAQFDLITARGEPKDDTIEEGVQVDEQPQGWEATNEGDNKSVQGWAFDLENSKEESEECGKMENIDGFEDNFVIESSECEEVEKELEDSKDESEIIKEV